LRWCIHVSSIGRLGDEAKTAYFGTDLPVQLGYFERLLAKNKEGKGYFVGDNFTIVGSWIPMFVVTILASEEVTSGFYSDFGMTSSVLEQADAKVWSVLDGHTSMDSTVLDKYPLLKGV